jgi:hypothetical protein
MNNTLLDTVSISFVRILNCNGQWVIGPECDFWNAESNTEPERFNVMESETCGWQNCLYLFWILMTILKLVLHWQIVITAVVVDQVFLVFSSLQYTCFIYINSVLKQIDCREYRT